MALHYRKRRALWFTLRDLRQEIGPDLLVVRGATARLVAATGLTYSTLATYVTWVDTSDERVGALLDHLRDVAWWDGYVFELLGELMRVRTDWPPTADAMYAWMRHHDRILAPRLKRSGHQGERVQRGARLALLGRPWVTLMGGLWPTEGAPQFRAFTRSRRPLRLLSLIHI